MPLLWRKRRKRRIRKEHKVSTLRHVMYGIASIAVVVLLGALVWYVAHMPALTISEVRIEGGETISHDRISSLVEKELTGSYLRLIPHRFSYLYPHDRIVEVVSATPRVHDVTLLRQPKNTLIVSFKEYIPHALWCLSSDSTSECYFMDKNGYAFTSAPTLRGGTLTRHIIEGTDILEERQVIDEDELEKTDTLSRVLYEGLGFRVGGVTHTSDGDVTYSINGGGSIYTTKNMTIEETFENLTSVLDSKEFSHIEPGNFNYIDLRFGNKVFVNEELEVATTTEESAGIKEEEPQDAAHEGADDDG